MVMKTKISALVDGELDAHEIRDVFIAMRQDAVLRAELHRVSDRYALIGDALRGESCLATNIAGAVRDQLGDEPVIFAPAAITQLPQQNKQPHKQSTRQWLRPALAMAATVAGVAVVAWLGLPTPSAQQPPLLAQAKVEKLLPQPLVQPVAHPLVVAAVEDPDVQEYLIAHQIHSGSVFLNGDTQHIRTVSMTGAESR
jgi:sigma-E factor negative regulatory protein RseA